MCTTLAMSNVANDDSAHSKLLFEAVKLNDTSVLMDLVLLTHCDPRYVRNDQQQTLLHFACQLNHSNVIDMVRILVEIYHCNPLLRDQHSLTAYHYACMSGNLLVLSYLSRSGNFHYNTDFIPPALLNVKYSKELKSQMLSIASKSGNIAMTRFTFMLFNHTRDILKLKLNLFNDALHVLCKNFNCSNLQGMHCFHDFSEDSIALYEACCAGNLQAVKFYLEELRVIVSHPLLPSYSGSRYETEKVHASLLEAAYRLNNVQIAQYLTVTRGFSPIQNITWHDSYINLCQFNPQYEFESQYFNMPGTSPLHMAIRSGNVQAVLESLSHDSHQLSSPIIGDHLTLLHSACISGKRDMVKIVTDKLKCDISACNSIGDTPLHVACEWGHLEICLFLLEQYGCKINSRNAYGHTPLLLAIRHNRFEIFQTLLEKGADISLITDAEETSLHFACCHDSSKFASALLGNAKCTVLLNARDKYGDTPLFNACRVGNIEVVRNLIVNSDCERLYVNPVTNETPAHIACRINRLDILRVLTSEGIDVPLKCNQVNHIKKSLLHLACENDSENIVNYLIESKVCKENNEDCNGHTPLHIAIIRGNFSIVKKLLMSQTCKITDKDKNENTVLHYVCNRQVVDSKLVKTLSDYSGQGASLIGKQNKDGYIPLHYICENGGVQVLQCLLEHFSLEEVNAALGCPNKLINNTPVHLAFKERKTAIIKYLWKCTELADGVSKAMLMQNRDGNNIFHLAMEYSGSDGDIIYNADGTQSSKTFAVTIIETVLQCMLSEDDVVLCLCQKNCKGFTPMEYLIDNSHPTSDCHLESSVLSCVLNSSKLTQSSKKNIFSVTSSSGDTLLHLATARYKFEVVKLLIEKCICDPKISNDKGETPLHLACTRGYSNLKIIMFLFEQGCNPHQLDKSGCSPLFNAFLSDQRLLLQLISKGYWTPECPIIELTSDNKNYGHYYKQTMLRPDSADPPTTFTLPLIHCVLFLSNQEHILKEMADIVVKHNIPNLCDSLENTILHVCSLNTFQNLDYLKKVLALSECDVNQLNQAHNTPLHIASNRNNASFITLLFESDKCRSLDIKNEERKTALIYAEDREMINCLILNGADPMDLAESARVKDIVEQMEKCKVDNPLIPTLTVLVLGNSLAGKTTLIKSLTEHYKWELVNPSIGQISKETERTVGVDMLEYKVFLENNVRILFYDYPGQTQFHSTNFVHLQNLMSNSQSSDSAEVLPILFFVVVDITMQDNLEQLKYWTSFIENCKSLSISGIPNIIVVGSHSDNLNFKVDQQSICKECMEQISSFQTVNFIEYNPILLDCRDPSTDEIQNVQALLLKSARTLKQLADLDKRCHVMFSYLYEHFPDKPVKFSEFCCKLREQNPAGFTAYNDYPLRKSYCVDLLKAMHSRQHIVIIGDCTEDFWILTAKAESLMFKKIHGCLFAGKDFKEHIKIQSNVGVLSSQLLKETFPDVDYKMLQEFLMCTELCKKIDDECVLNLIEHGSSIDPCSQNGQKENSSLESTAAIGTDEQCSSLDYFFFPGLIEATKDDVHIWHNETYCYFSAWLLNFTIGNPRFLQVLLLRLTFKFAAISKPDTKLRRECIVWNNGLFWSSQRVEMLVEVIDQNKMVVFFLRCLKGAELKCIELRSAVMKEVCDVKAKQCPAIGAHESFICNPSLDVQGSLVKPFQEVAMRELASAIICGVEEVKDIKGQYVNINSSLLGFEPYALVEDGMLKSMFDPKKANEIVQENVLSSLFNKADSEARPTHVEQFKQLISDLKKPVLYHNLRDLFDKYSVFHGRDPKGLILSSN